MYVPPRLHALSTYVLLEQEDWFEDEIRFVRRWLQPGMRAIDVGANIGAYALAMATAVGPRGSVWAFEPTPEASDLLEHSARRNALRQLQVLRNAVSSQPGQVCLSLSAQTEYNTIVPMDSASASESTVAAVTLDGQAAACGWEGIDFVKLDVEGHERQVIDGGRAFLDRESPLVMFEIKAGHGADLGLLDILGEMGFAFYRLLPGALALVPFRADEPLDDYQLNLFACKADRASLLASAGFLLPEATGEPGRASAGAWASHLRSRPYGRAAYAARWVTAPGFWAPAHEKLYHEGLCAYVSFADGRQALDQRLGALEQALACVREAARERPSVFRDLSLARLEWEAGSRALAVKALLRATERLAAADISGSEACIPPLPRFEQKSAERLQDWLQCAALESLEKLRSYSSYFSEGHTLSLLRPLADNPLRSPESDRRCLLVRMRAGMRCDPASTVRLAEPTEDNLNPAFWRGALALA
jgi:FkbM family methyltransferase